MLLHIGSIFVVWCQHVGSWVNVYTLLPSPSALVAVEKDFVDLGDHFGFQLFFAPIQLHSN